MARQASDARSTPSTPATLALAAAGVSHTLHQYTHDARRSPGTSWGLEAAAALGLDPATVLKTLLIVLEDARPALAVAVVAVDDQLDIKAAAAALGSKRGHLAEPAAAERATGYVVGGISPLGQRQRLPTVVDLQAMEHGTVYVSGGRRGLDIGLAPADLVRLTGARVAPVSRNSRAVDIG